MKQDVEVGSGAMMYTQNFRYLKINRLGNLQARKEHGDLISKILFLKKE
jgi:hypothetical protein